MGMFLIGTCGAIGTDDLLACFVAGNLLNWDGEFLAETERRHDEVNSCIDVLLNFGKKVPDTPQKPRDTRRSHANQAASCTSAPSCRGTSSTSPSSPASPTPGSSHSAS
ncbi:hypothetical protein IMZ48_27265 [Candidatus Bathyarchaeota archaeon]|nr:hypothetical protein [Candidatus Bathyarchaeota archaeon]